MSGEKKAPQNARILAALLTSETYEGAARQAGVSLATVRRKMADPAFRAELRKASDEPVAIAKTIMRKLSSRAALAIARALECKKPTVELHAAEVVWNAIGRFTADDDFEERLAALESRQAAADAGPPKLHREAL